MYQKIIGSEDILSLEDGTVIPPGHWMWPEDEALIQDAPPPPTAQRNELFRQGISRWMDSVVQANGYDHMVSCVSYTGSGNPKFAAEAAAAIAWRDAVWLAGYALLADPPEDVERLEDVIALLPSPTEFGWVPDPLILERS